MFYVFEKMGRVREAANMLNMFYVIKGGQSKGGSEDVVVFEEVEWRWLQVPSISHFEQGRGMGWLEEKPPPPSCVSSKRGSGWRRNIPPPSCVSSKGGSREVVGKETPPPSILHFEEGREG